MKTRMKWMQKLILVLGLALTVATLWPAVAGSASKSIKIVTDELSAHGVSTDACVCVTLRGNAVKKPLADAPDDTDAPYWTALYYPPDFLTSDAGVAQVYFAHLNRGRTKLLRAGEGQIAVAALSDALQNGGTDLVRLTSLFLPDGQVREIYASQVMTTLATLDPATGQRSDSARILTVRGNTSLSFTVEGKRAQYTLTGGAWTDKDGAVLRVDPWTFLPL
ncbi:MAG: hypothetical protein LBN05_03120 [Oscillospiraceae bacterium]|jgi:hypothetical protein|nr:hypothetical protein [Oscillospiraceae bacterium]